MARRKDLHVVPHSGKGWAVRKPGAKRVSSTHRTQKEAIDDARGRLRRESGSGRRELVIHREGGKIRDSRSYGNDPVPPVDQ